ncbi:MAG: methyltransferase domain-containing protein [Phycisphaerae bacterium]|nr:methyltransferase domain-containing protein [Phycisphaerae bacterium]
MSMDARAIAVRALRDKSGNISAHLSRLLAECDLSAEDRGLAHELTIGVVRRRGTLDAVLRAYLRQPGKKLPSPVRAVLQVAVYQILYLQRIPVFAAVDQAVNQIVHIHHKRQSGLVNGLLRTLVREMSAPIERALEPAPARNLVPISETKIRRIGRNIFCDPAKRPADYLAEAYSLPEELAERWIEQFGSLEAAIAVAEQTCARPPLICRVNRLRSDAESVVANLQADGIDAKLHENGCSVVLPSGANITGLRAFADGLIQPQDPTATAVVLNAKIKPGVRVLDFCAAPGTKTTHIAERMENRGEIVAVDVSREKLNKIDDNCRRLGIDIVKTCLAEEIGELDFRSFDLVLADVPCSNTGVLARRPEARWRFSGKSLSTLIRDQQLIAAAAAEYVAPGGQMIYSTCSIEPDEGGRIVKGLLKRVSHLKPAGEKLTLPAGIGDPTRWHDGGFAAIFNA